MHFPKSIQSVIILSLTILMSGCNVFSRFDHPTNDAQLLSAARAAFDHGDFDEARALYQRLSSDHTDIGLSESAFVTMAQEGMTMAAFMEFVGNGANGQALTKLANRLTSGSGQARRLALHSAFNQHKSITNTELKAFVKFTTSLALAAEVLAEAAGTDGRLSKADLVTNPAGCNTTFPNANCNPSGSILIDTNSPSTSADLMNHSPAGTSPNIDHLYYAIVYASEGLQEIGAQGEFGSTGSGFGSIITQSGTTPTTNASATQGFLGQLTATGGFNVGE